MIQLLVGAVLGATTALLLAPSTGAGTRAKLKDQGKRLQYNLERLSEYADQKKQQFAHKLLGFQHDLECVRDKAQEKAEDLKQVASEKAETIKTIAVEKRDTLKSIASEKAEDIKHLAEKADAFKEKAAQKAEILKNDLGELKKDFDEAIQDFRTPSDTGQPESSRKGEQGDVPPKPPATRTPGGTV